MLLVGLMTLFHTMLVECVIPPQRLGMQRVRHFASKSRPPAGLRRMGERFDQFSYSVNNTKWKRRLASICFMGIYTAAGLAGWQYLQDTKYKAIGAPNPYNSSKAEKNENQTVPAHDTTPVYDQLATDYDSKIWMEELMGYIWWMRRKVASKITGDALEVACGTGRNIGWLRPKQLHSITFLDSSRPMLELARDKFSKKFNKFENVQYVQGKAEGLVSLTGESHQLFDTVYETFGLCAHEDPSEALNQMKKLVRPGGKLILLEHGRGYFDSMNRRMDERASQRAEEWGCRWNLDIDSIVRGAGLSVVEEKRYHFGTIYFYVLEQPQTQLK